MPSRSVQHEHGTVISEVILSNVGITLETERLLLRPFCMDDVEAVASYSHNMQAMRFMDLPPQTWDSTRRFVAGLVEEGQPNAKGDWHFAVDLKERPGALIGAARIGVPDPGHSHEASLGYAMNSRHWGVGYATEAARRLLRFGFDELGLERIWAFAAVDNAASRRVMVKSGMRLEGILRRHRLLSSGWRDSALYACVRGDPV